MTVPEGVVSFARLYEEHSARTASIVDMEANIGAWVLSWSVSMTDNGGGVGESTLRNLEALISFMRVYKADSGRTNRTGYAAALVGAWILS